MENPMVPDLHPELSAVLEALHLDVADVASWRIEGFQIVILTTAGAKHRLPTLAHTARLAAEEAARTAAEEVTQ